MKALLLLIILSGCSYKCADGIVWREYSHGVWIKHQPFDGPVECKTKVE